MRGLQRVSFAPARQGGTGTQNNHKGKQGRGLGLTAAALRFLVVVVLSHAPERMLQAQSPATWQPVGPSAEVTANYGLVTGRVTALALDPSDATGNRLYVGTTGGGVWEAENAGVSNASLVTFNPLTDVVEALSGAFDASISIGAIGVQPGGTGVILAGTGDPNDALDSYYGAGILRSTDGGNSWSLITATGDNRWGFPGEAFAGFAWSTVNPQLVVAAVSQAYEGTLVNVDLSHPSYEGVYYSEDSGATWNLATLTDGANQVVQGPGALFDAPDGNAATAVVWNPVRQLFVAAVRFHGYYQSADGMTWTRMAAQPGAGLTAQACPTHAGQTGSMDCPIFRGSLAVNPLTGDTFAWTVDVNDQDQGLWQDACALSNGVCGNANITFAQRLGTQVLETITAGGPSTIAGGGYTLALAAVPAAAQQGADTLLLAGAEDLWRCSLAQGCGWRNTTHATTCMTAQVAGFEHALAWNPDNPLEIFVGNDGGLWRSLDAIGETGQPCDGGDATHFQNLNGGLGSLAEVQSLAMNGSSAFTMMTGLGVNGTAGLKSATAQADWPQILGGYGGPVAIDPRADSNWYVNSQDGVAIYLCVDASSCTPGDFGTTPVVNDNDVSGDGDAMASPAPFLVDPLDTTQLLIGTCRVWRGPANGTGWSGTNAISPILDSGATGVACSGDALIRSMAALPVRGTREVVYLGMYGASNGGGSLPGHVFSATVDLQSASMPVWQDLTANPVTNSPNTLNEYGLDISSIFIDSHDPTGNTVYATVEGFSKTGEAVQTVYGSRDGGVHWASYTANLPSVPVSGLVVDPQSASTVYLATDTGVYFTTQISTCANLPSTCWAVFGSGLPLAPVTELNAAPPTAEAQVLTAGTYGRGVWQTPLWSAGTALTMATANPNALTFADQSLGIASSPQTVTLTNTGSLPLSATAITVSGDFSETDDCQGAAIAMGGNCTLQVTFTPTAAGSRTGQVTLSANVYGGQLTVSFSGTGTATGPVSLTPASLNFGQVQTGSTSAPLEAAVANSSGMAVPITNIAVTPPFILAVNACGTTALAADAECQLTVEFAPTQPGAATGTLTLTDGAGTQTILLSGTGITVSLAPAAISFDPSLGQTSNSPPVAVGATSGLFQVAAGNSSLTPVPITSLFITPPFAIASNTCGATQLAASADCQLQLTFSPTQEGAAAGTLTLVDGAGTQTVALSGFGYAAATDFLSPPSVAFGEIAENQVSAAQTVTLTNTGDLPLTSISVSVSTGFQMKSGCGTLLAPHSPCAISVEFAPTQLGSQTGMLSVSDITRAQPQTVALSGTGVAPAALTVSPTALSFSSQDLNVASAPQTFTVTNTGGVAITNMGFEKTGEGASNFSCGATICSATTCGATLAPGSNCTVQVIFMPASTGELSASLIVAADDVKTPATVALTGSGLVPFGLNASPPQLIFLPTVAGSSSAAQTVIVSNSSNFAASQLAFSVSPGFLLTQNTCTESLASGATCTVGVVFAPASTGAKTGMLSAMSPSIGTPAMVTLSGTGALAAAIEATSTPLSFPTVGVGQTSNQITVTVTNSGASEPLNNLALSVPAGFQLANNTCGAQLGPGASCTAGVEFAPTAAGAQSGMLTVSSSTVANAVQLPLQGTGFDFTVAVSGASAQSVAGGLSASYTLVLTPLNGSSGAFTFACKALPANAVCVFTPSGETLNAGVTGNVTAQVATGGVAVSARLRRQGAWGVLPLVCGLLVLPLGWKRKHKVLGTVILLVLLAFLVGGVGSCASSGGGTGGLGANGGGLITPAGTYSIPVTVTSTGVSHNATLTLTVD